MSNVIAKIFGSTKVINAGISGIDKAIYSAEEKADYHLKFLSAYEPFKLAQRVIAFSFVIPFIAFGSFGLAFNNEEIVTKAIDMFGTPVAIIVGFYFAGGVFKK